MRIILALFLCVTILSALSAKTVITHESMWLMKRTGAPVPSPDGKWVVFSVTEPAYDPKDQVSDLWMAPSDGSTAPRRITATKAAEAGVSWSGDSAKIVFSAKRDADEPHLSIFDKSCSSHPVAYGAVSLFALTRLRPAHQATL